MANTMNLTETKIIDELWGVEQLVEDLFDPHRSGAVVVLSTSKKVHHPYFDVEWLESELEDSARLVVLANSMAALRFTERLGDERLSVFGGAGRVYPPGHEWTSDPFGAPLVFCYPGQGRSSAEKIVAHVRSISYRFGLSVTPTRETGDIATTADVIGCPTESQIFVRTQDGLTCKMLAVHLYPGVEASRLVRAGQRFQGRERVGSIMGDFFPDKIDDDALGRARECFADGSIAFALVDSVTPSEAKLMLHPAVEAALVPRDENLTHLLSQGDVVAVELIWDENGFLADLARAADACPAMSLLPDGPPWLIPEELRGEHDAVSEIDMASDIDQASPSLQLEPEEANATVVLLTEHQQQLEAELVQLRNEIKALKKERRESQASKRPRVHADEEEQFRFEVLLSYLTRVSPADRKEYPLPSSHHLGKDFLESLDRQVTAGAIRRDKIVDVCTDVLCGRAMAIPSRVPKPWLVSKQGPQQDRPDGAKAWRVRLQVNSSSARRMKYWVRADRTVEFESVGVHDEGL